jgi:hypothetical protein
MLVFCFEIRVVPLPSRRLAVSLAVTSEHSDIRFRAHIETRVSQTTLALVTSHAAGADCRDEIDVMIQASKYR